jgi:hypothetical protein
MPESIHGDVSQYDPRPLPPITSHNDAAPTTTPLPTPRELLKQRSAAVEAAKGELQKAQGFADRSARMFEAATTTFRESQTVSHAVLTFKVATFKKGSTDPIPNDLVEARRAAIFAAEEHEHAQAVAGQMSNELIGPRTTSRQPRRPSQAPLRMLFRKRSGAWSPKSTNWAGVDNTFVTFSEVHLLWVYPENSTENLLR